MPIQRLPLIDSVKDKSKSVDSETPYQEYFEGQTITSVKLYQKKNIENSLQKEPNSKGFCTEWNPWIQDKEDFNWNDCHYWF